MIKNNIIFIFLLIGMIGSSIVSYLNFKSTKEQTFLLFDFNSGGKKLGWDFVKDFNDEFPNIMVTTLPLKTIKAYYLFKEDLYDEALKLIHTDNSNPYLGIKETYLADIYEKLDIYDSLFFYRKKAFELLPNNTRHHTTYFNLLADKKDSLELELSFNKVNVKKLITYKNYIYNSGRVKKNKNHLIKMADSLLKLFPEDDQLKEIKQQTILGIERYLLSEISEKKAEDLFLNSNFEKSIIKYKEAIKLNPYLYQYYESIGINFMKIQMLDSAKYYFREAINKREDKNGKSEYYLGAIILNENKIDSACYYFRTSYRLGYENSLDLINTYCKQKIETPPKSNKLNSLN